MIKNLKRGDVVLVDFGATLRPGQDSLRPWVIIQNDKFSDRSSTTIVAEIIRYEEDDGDLYWRPYEVWINKNEGVLDFFCSVCCDQIRTIRKEQITKKLASLNTIHLDNLDKALKRIFALE